MVEGQIPETEEDSDGIRRERTMIVEDPSSQISECPSEERRSGIMRESGIDGFVGRE